MYQRVFEVSLRPRTNHYPIAIILYCRLESKRSNRFKSEPYECTYAKLVQNQLLRFEKKK